MNSYITEGIRLSLMEKADQVSPVDSRFLKSLVFTGVTSGDFLNVFLRDLLGFLQVGEDGEFRADQTAQAAFNAVLRLGNQFGRVISLGVETFALFQTFIRAEFNTEATSFATVFYNMNQSLGNRMSF